MLRSNWEEQVEHERDLRQFFRENNMMDSQGRIRILYGALLQTYLTDETNKHDKLDFDSCCCNSNNHEDLGYDAEPFQKVRLSYDSIT